MLQNCLPPISAAVTLNYLSLNRLFSKVECRAALHCAAARNHPSLAAWTKALPEVMAAASTLPSALEVEGRARRCDGSDEGRFTPHVREQDRRRQGNLTAVGGASARRSSRHWRPRPRTTSGRSTTPGSTELSTWRCEVAAPERHWDSHLAPVPLCPAPEILV